MVLSLFKKKKKMEWNNIHNDNDLEGLKSASNQLPVLIFKHSTRCSISSMALSRLERSWGEAASDSLTPYMLDLISYRDLSQKIANDFNVHHESPQVLVVKDGKCIYHASHMEINLADIQDSFK